MEEIVFRKAKITDAAYLSELRMAQLCEEGTSSVETVKENIFRFFEEHLETDSFVMWVSIVGGEIIATGAVTFYEKPPYVGNPNGLCGHVSCMYTIKPYRKRGIAKQIMGRLVSEASKKNCPLLEVNSSNDGVGFYKEFGFEKKENGYQLII